MKHITPACVFLYVVSFTYAENESAKSIVRSFLIGQHKEINRILKKLDTKIENIVMAGEDEEAIDIEKLKDKLKAQQEYISKSLTQIVQSETVFYGSGEKKRHTEYYVGKNNKKVKHGKETFWYEDGKKSRELSFDHGLENGKWMTWYKNGQLASIFSYKKGIDHGEWKFWYEDGKIARITIYKSGKSSGTWRWYKDGKEIASRSYDDQGNVIREPISK